MFFLPFEADSQWFILSSWGKVSIFTKTNSTNVEGIRKHHVSTPKKIIDSVKDHQSLMDAKVIQQSFVEEDPSKVLRLVPVITCQLKSKKKQKQTAMEQCNFDQFIKLQFSSVTQSCLTICDPIDHSTPGFPIHHQLLEFTQTHIHLVGDAIQPSHPLLSPSPPTFNPSQHQGLF